MNLTHRRYNPLTDQWVLVSPKRTSRPWQGDVEEVPEEYSPDYDPNCYLCPGNTRANGQVNPKYTKTFVFDNDFPALTMDPKNSVEDFGHRLLKAEHENGVCRVVCFTPNHRLTLPELSQTQVEDVIETWKDQTIDLFGRKDIAYVQIFENKGAQMGCSNPHPHSQIWSQSHIPNEPLAELNAQTTYFNENFTPMLVDYVKEEIKRKERIIASNDHFTTLVPFWAVWPFETLISAHKPISYLQQLSSEEISAFAEMILTVTTKYDNLFKISFPYSMGIHQAPNDHARHPEWVLHAHFYPPLLRSAYVRKFMVGYEMLAMPQRDITPEEAAERLRNLPDNHYKCRK